MTMTRSQHRKQGKGLRNFHEKLNESNVQQQLLNNQCDTAAHGRDGAGRTWYSQYHEEAQGRSLEGGADHLLILAQSAEIVEQSENCFTGMYRNNQNTGSNNSAVEQMSKENVINATIDGIQRSGFSNEVRRPRLTQIRKQARQNYILLDEEKSEDSQCQHLDGKAIRLSQMKHKARCIGINDLSSQEMVIGDKIEQPPENIVRLGHIKHLARLKGQSTAKEATERHIEGHLNCNKFEDNKKEKLVARQFGKEVISQTGNHIEVASGKGQKRIRPKGSNLPVFKTVAAAHNFLRGVDQPSVVTNSETQKEFSSVKGRTRLTQLRCEARLGNQSSVMERCTEN